MGNRSPAHQAVVADAATRIDTDVTRFVNAVAVAIAERGRLAAFEDYHAHLQQQSPAVVAALAVGALVRLAENGGEA